MQAIIDEIYALEVLDSRGNPTVEAHVKVRAGDRLIHARAGVPSGASTGRFEAVELRDGGSRLFGKGVRQAVDNVNCLIAPHLRGMGVGEQAVIDRKLIALDGTDNKGRLGANAILAVSTAIVRAGAKVEALPLYRYIRRLTGIEGGSPMCKAYGDGEYTLPVPMMNILNGGCHSDNALEVQEFMIVPQGADSFAQGVEMCCEVYHRLKGLLKGAGLSTGVGDEGGFAPELRDTRDAIEHILRAVEEAGCSKRMGIALDVAASELLGEDGAYHLEGNRWGSGELVDYYRRLCEDYPIVSIEDGLDQEDWQGWKDLTGVLGDRIMLVGDDLFVTNVGRIERGIREGCGNCVLIKPNQIGTVSEAIEAVSLAHKNGMGAVMSHRSGETEDTTIADMAVGLGCGRIKTGAPCRGERTAKYNRLLNIEREIGGQ